MKVGKTLLFFCLVCLWTGNSLYAQTPYCKNLGFELGNFTNWTGYTWRYSEAADAIWINTNPAPGFVSRRHTIMSDTSAYDANTGYALSLIHISEPTRPY